eukprot:6446704-Ditylum_brightwellii.AAC.1
MPFSQKGSVEVAYDTNWEDMLINGNVHLKGEEITLEDRSSHVVKPTIPGLSPCDKRNSKMCPMKNQLMSCM